ncbi:EI24 domain-containing protein [Rhodocyclus tenuis]|uniref:EI24 domain-containing protein n=1 Tax=Rhodocyclus tenuis TaxID=1066 RepID=UPI00190345E3|nr:EI24 domain-containing protein [Rhodocyclus tenuis]MBK1680229.1 hypothetical protein [Rhodocyclus tenuis]
MPEMVVALVRSLRTLAWARIWLYVLGPAVVSLLAWIALALFVLDRFVALLLDQPPLSWLSGWGAVWLAKLLAVLGGWALVLAAATLTAILLTAIFVLPLLLRQVAAREYPDLAALGSDSTAASTWNSVSAAALFAVGWVVTLPLWLIPGAALVLPLFLLAWLNRRTFAYDALAVHASDDERRQLLQQQRVPLLALGGVAAVLAHVPLLGLLAPTLAALAYIHFCLEALRQLRRGAVVTVIVGEGQ